MKSLLAALAVCVFVVPTAVEAGNSRECVPHWSAPSPTLDNKCHHRTGAPFATCDCERGYTSPHIMGYGGMAGCCKYQPGSCLSPFGCGAGWRRMSPTYCESVGASSGRFYGYGDLAYGPGPIGACPGGCAACGSDMYSQAFVGFEQLGSIPNDSAAAGLPATGGRAATGGLLGVGGLDTGANIGSPTPVLP